MENMKTNSPSHPDGAPTPNSGGGTSRSLVRVGRTLSGLYVLFMLGASVTPKLLGMPVVEATMTQLGWPRSSGFWLGILELGCVILYLLPRASVFGAVVSTGLLGGAMATHIRAGSPLASHILFPIYVGLFMWGGLWLRSPELRKLFPLIRR
jgi:hypothetical protein